jgi:two-component system, chemotaxis family, chemotaxis protein CheY
LFCNGLILTKILIDWLTALQRLTVKHAATTTANASVAAKFWEKTMQRILLIEDCASTLNMISRELTSSGFEVTSTTNAADGMEILKSEKIHAVVSDLNMASLSGFEVLSQIKAEPKLQDVPVIIITGDIDDDNRRFGIEGGAAAWMTKPFRMEELTAAVRLVL